jgi:hypothetical protein
MSVNQPANAPGTPETPAQSGVYVYAVAPADRFPEGKAGFQVTGIGDAGEPIRTIRHGDLVAIVSNTSRPRYELRREYLLGHERVLEDALQRSDLLPVAFSTIAGSDEAIRRQLLERRFDELHAYLEDVRNRVELGLKVLWNQEALFAEVVEESDEIQALRATIAGRPEDATYYDRIRLGELTEAGIAAKGEAESAAILDALSPLAVDTRVNQNFMEMMILNASFLVDKSREQAFDERVTAMGEAQAGRLIFKYVGPLPAYDFVTIKVQWER